MIKKVHYGHIRKKNNATNKTNGIPLACLRDLSCLFWKPEYWTIRTRRKILALESIPVVLHSTAYHPILLTAAPK